MSVAYRTCEGSGVTVGYLEAPGLFSVEFSLALLQLRILPTWQLRDSLQVGSSGLLRHSKNFGTISSKSKQLIFADLLGSVQYEKTFP